MINIFKNIWNITISSWRVMLDDLFETLRLYSLSLIIPISFTIIYFISGVLLDIKLKLGVVAAFKSIWVDYYITGSLFNIDAWRIHLTIFLVCLFCIKLDKIK